MNTGKIASQAGHAYVNSFLTASKEVQDEYQSDGIGTKVCLECSNIGKLAEAHASAQKLGLPCVMIQDTGSSVHCFNGMPTYTAVGIGPIIKSQAPFLKKFHLLK
jgi:peptidyl-tRNA hydrolase